MGVTVRQKQPGKDNPWWVFINHQGKRKAKLVGDKKAAEKVASLIREKLKKQELLILDVERKVPCFEEYAEEWLTTYAKSFCKESTGEGYAAIINKHLVPFFATVPIDQIRRKDVRRLISTKLSEGLTAGTVRNIRLCLSSILSTGVEDEALQANPAMQLGRRVKKTLKAGDGKEDVDFLTKEEVLLFLKNVKKHCPEYYALFLCAVRTGMRAGELIGLKAGDIDFNGMFIKVRRNVVRGRVTTPKSGESRRVDMSRQLAETLRGHLLETKRITLEKGWKERPEWLFFNQSGHFLEINNVRKRYFYKCLEKAELRQVRFHDLRHTYASLLISQGESLAYVRDQMGHSSIKVTVDTYGHLVPGSNREAVDKLDDVQPVATPAQPEALEAEKKVLSFTPST